jgi:hypothetical protein
LKTQFMSRIFNILNHRCYCWSFCISTFISTNKFFVNFLFIISKMVSQWFLLLTTHILSVSTIMEKIWGWLLIFWTIDWVIVWENMINISFWISGESIVVFLDNHCCSSMLSSQWVCKNHHGLFKSDSCPWKDRPAKHQIVIKMVQRQWWEISVSIAFAWDNCAVTEWLESLQNCTFFKYKFYGQLIFSECCSTWWPSSNF